MIGLAPRDDVRALRIPALEVILPRELQRRLDRFRTTARVPNPIERSRRHFRDHRRELLGGFAGEKTGVNILEARRLLGHRGHDFAMAMPEARHSRSAARIDVAPAILVDQVDAVPADSDRRPRVRGSVKDVLGPHCSLMVRAFVFGQATCSALRFWEGADYAWVGGRAMKATRMLLAAVALAGAQPASAELDLHRAAITHLPNGLTVILLEDHSFPLVSVQTLYKSGSAAETTGKTGLAHFLEHLVFRGSEHFPKARATELIYDAGGEWHGYTAMDQTTYFATMPKDGLDLLLRIDADRMARTIIDPASIEAEKGAVITELHSYENDPASVLLETVTRTAIQAHPYGSPMAGYVSDVIGLTAADARAYYASHYAPGNAVLAVVGDFSLEQARALVDKRFCGRARAAGCNAKPDGRIVAERHAPDANVWTGGTPIFPVCLPCARRVRSRLRRFSRAPANAGGRCGPQPAT